MSAKIIFFPVGNGDMALLSLDNGQTLLIDCNIRQAADDESDDTLDVAQELRKRLNRDSEGRLFVNVMSLSHPDQDHCSGLKNHFHLGPPDSWDPDEDKILINEMWSSPIVFRRASKRVPLVPNAKEWAAEARRRVGLYRDNPNTEAVEGNRILILGEDENGKTDDLADILVKVDEFIVMADRVNTGAFEARLLGPLAIASDEDEEEALSKNRSSVILSFSLAGDRISDRGRYLTGGDAEVGVWARLWRKHKSRNADWLTYHFLLSPHHCSWHSLSEDSWSDLGEKVQVDPDARSALSQTLEGAVIVGSSKPVNDDDSDPPCIRAKREYVSILDGDDEHFYCTGEYPSESAPEILEFIITSLGPEKKSRTLRSVAGTLGVGATSRTPRDHGE